MILIRKAKLKTFQFSAVIKWAVYFLAMPGAEVGVHPAGGSVEEHKNKTAASCDAPACRQESGGLLEEDVRKVA
jgi:hypothetical protein